MTSTPAKCKLTCDHLRNESAILPFFGGKFRYGLDRCRFARVFRVSIGPASQAQRVTGREPVQAGNQVPVSAGSPGGGTMVHQPLPFHYTGQSFLVRRLANPGS
jgi:hypothetical protein